MTTIRRSDEIRADIAVAQQPVPPGSRAFRVWLDARRRLLADVGPLLDQVQRLAEGRDAIDRLAQFGIPLHGDPDRTFCEVCRQHYPDLALHDYERHGIRPGVPALGRVS